MDRQSINRKFGVTNEELDLRAEEYENGTWEGKLGKVIMGRPSIANEEVRPVTFRLPVSKIAALERLAKEKGETKSKFLRDAVDKALTA